jgi:hypothetical protein
MHGKQPTIKRNSPILFVFLATDDALQGILGLHIYTSAISRETIVRSHQIDAAKTIQLRITEEWARIVNLKRFISAMEDSFEFMHCRTALLGMVANFEVALKRFRRTLWEDGHLGPNTGKKYAELHYKALLHWAFEVVQKSQCGSPSMLARLPDTCGEVDNARRLRNLSLHSNFKYDGRYVADAIAAVGVTPHFEVNHAVGVQNREPVFLTNDRFEKLAHCHIELLHILHNTIQKKFYACQEDYNYAKEGKTEELYRMVSGRRDVDV